MLPLRPLLPGIRGAVLLCGCAAGIDGAWRLARAPLAAATGPLLTHGPRGVAGLAFETVLVGACAAALLGCVLWLSVTTTLAVASYAVQELFPQRSQARAFARVAERGCPRLVRHLVGVAVGVAVTVGVAGPALADSTGSDSTGSDSTGLHSTGRCCLSRVY